MKKQIAYILLLLLGLYSTSAFAYMDPNGANLFVQLVLPIISVITAFFVFVRRWFVTKIKYLFAAIKAKLK